MAEENKKAPAGPKVSPARTAVSLIVLLIVGVVCVIELRAGLGQMMSGKALAAKSNDGEFTDLSLEDARGMLALAPSETVEERGPDRMHRFEWYSVLRPLMGQKNPNLMIIASNDEKSMALAFTTEEEVPIPMNQGDPVPPPPGGPEAAGMGGGMMGMGSAPTGDGEKKRPEMEEDSEATDSAPVESPAETPAAAETPPAETEPAAAEPARGDAPAAENP